MELVCRKLRHISEVNRHWFGFCFVAEMTWFKSQDQNYLSFGVGASKSTWYWIGDRNWLDFSDGIELDLISVLGWNWLGFRGGGRNRIVFCTRVEGHLFLVWSCQLSYLCQCCTELIKVSGSGIDVPTLPNCLVPVLMLYRTSRTVR